MNEYEWVVIDPLLGEVSCDNLERAVEYARGVNGKVFCVVWNNGREIDRYPEECLP